MIATGGGGSHLFCDSYTGGGGSHLFSFLGVGDFLSGFQGFISFCSSLVVSTG